MTYVPTWAGFIFLAIVLDVWSRRVVGWAICEEMTADLVLAALNMALQQRKPAGVIHHSDQGSQYTSIAFGERCKKHQGGPAERKKMIDRTHKLPVIRQCEILEFWHGQLRTTHQNRRHRRTCAAAPHG